MMKLAGNVASTGEKLEEYRVLVGKPEGNKQLVRHRSRWEDNIKMDFREVRWDDGPPLWSSGQSFWLQIERSRVRLLSLPDFLRSRGSQTGST
jgi:hypothetical protein